MGKRKMVRLGKGVVIYIALSVLAAINATKAKASTHTHTPLLFLC
jgi:hypothetical protein